MGVKGCDHNKKIREFIPLSEYQIRAFAVSELKSDFKRRWINPNTKENKVTFRDQITKEYRQKEDDSKLG